MTFTEAEELCLDVLTEYLPKSIGKVTKMEIVRALLQEFLDQEVVELEDDERAAPDGEEEDEEDLTSLIR